MKRTLVFAAALASLASLTPASTPAFIAEDAFAWSHRYMIVNGNSDATLVGATSEMARHSRLRTPEMNDLLAEVLVRIRDGEFQADEAALDIVRILTAAPNGGRYHALFRNLRDLDKKSAMKAMLSKYGNKFRRPVGEQFVAGTIDLDSMRQEFVAAALAAKPTPAQAQALSKLPKTATMDELFATVGTPAHVVPRDTRAAQTAGGIDVRQIVFHYRGVGLTRYEFRRDEGWFPKDVIVDPLAFESAMPYRKDAAALGMPDDATLAMIQLVSGFPIALRTSAMSVHRLDAPPREWLDTAAELLLRDYAKISTPTEIDAYSWLCNVFAHHGGRRYAGVLATVAKGAPDEKLQRYAKQIVYKREVEGGRYVPGAVSLEDQARIYPTLYPGIAPSDGR
jgi:hypothetical protein